MCLFDADKFDIHANNCINLRVSLIVETINHLTTSAFLYSFNWQHNASPKYVFKWIEKKIPWNKFGVCVWHDDAESFTIIVVVLNICLLIFNFLNLLPSKN